MLGGTVRMPAGPYWLAATLGCPVYLTFGLFHEPTAITSTASRSPSGSPCRAARGRPGPRATRRCSPTPRALLPARPRQLVQLLRLLEGPRVNDSPALRPLSSSSAAGRSTLSQICEIAAGRARAALTSDPAARARLDASRASLERQLRAGARSTASPTGVGESCETPVPPESTGEFSATCCASTAAARARRSATRRAPRWCRASGLAVPRLFGRASCRAREAGGAARPPHPAAHPGRGLGGRQRRSHAAVVRGCRR